MAAATRDTPPAAAREFRRPHLFQRPEQRPPARAHGSIRGHHLVVVGGVRLVEPVATELLVGPVYFRLMFGGVLDLDFAERIVDGVMRGYSA